MSAAAWITEASLFISNVQSNTFIVNSEKEQLSMMQIGECHDSLQNLSHSNNTSL